jgi:hypothetical protein
MKYLITFVIFGSSLVHLEALAETKAYSLCPNIQSVHYSDPKRNRSIVMNYDPVRKYFVFLRCGGSDTARVTSRVQENKCHIYRQGHEGALCRDEIIHSRVSRVIADVVDAGVSTAVYGPMSNLAKVRRVISTARQLRVTPQCLGTSMMKAMVLGVNSSAITDTFYQAATEIGPMTGLMRFSTRNPAAKASYVFSQLDSIIAPGARSFGASNGRGVNLTGPVYMTAQRNNKGVDKLVLDTAEHQSLCTYMKNLGNEPGAPTEEAQSRAISSEKDGLINLD